MKHQPNTITELSQRLRSYLDKTTPGKWHASKGSIHSAKPKTEIKNGWRSRILPKDGRFNLVVCETFSVATKEDVANARFIAAAHNDLPVILSRLELVEKWLRWIPVGEAVPEMDADGNRSRAVEVWIGSHEEGTWERAFYYKNGTWFLDDSDFDCQVHPTHWRHILRPDRDTFPIGNQQ